MARKRDKPTVRIEDNSEDDLESVVSKKRGSKKRKCKDVKLFRANLGPMHDLFREIEKKGLKLNKAQLDALKSTTFFPLLQVFMENQIKKEELTKCSNGLTMLVKTISGDGFKLCAEGDVFIPTPEDMALIFGFQLIENGIEEKLNDERKVNVAKNDLCVTYKIGNTTPPCLKSTDVMVAILTAIGRGKVEDVVRLIVLYMCQTIFFSKTGNFNLPCSFLVYVKSLEVINRISWPHLIHKAMMESIKSADGDVQTITGCSFYLLYWFAEHCSLVKRREDAKTFTPRFARWDTFKISKSISGLKHFPLTKTEAERMKLSRNLITDVEDGFERKLLTPVRQMSRLDKLKERVAELEKENIGLRRDKEDREIAPAINTAQQRNCTHSQAKSISELLSLVEEKMRDCIGLEEKLNDLSLRKDVVDTELIGYKIECSELKKRVAELEEGHRVLFEKEKNRLEKEKNDNMGKDLSDENIHLKEQVALVCEREKAALNMITDFCGKMQNWQRETSDLIRTDSAGRKCLDLSSNNRIERSSSGQSCKNELN
ncbi:hypothetical protein MKW94_021879 [Papaver nudicaule]|uniref:Aminotransferase-like plant mobile domain-containing protein n=1 Tax=Papaver nudicaule TaxID=74823 RepID=A0AA41SK37_PAPNU|nr:hypothetical protein [Papaver nudicaule]